MGTPLLALEVWERDCTKPLLWVGCRQSAILIPKIPGTSGALCSHSIPETCAISFPDNLARGQMLSDDLLYLVWLSLVQMRPPSHALPLCLLTLVARASHRGSQSPQTRPIPSLCRMYSIAQLLVLLLIICNIETRSDCVHYCASR